MINKSKNVCLKNVIQKGKKHEKINRNQLQKYFKTSGLSNYKKNIQKAKNIQIIKPYFPQDEI